MRLTVDRRAQDLVMLGAVLADGFTGVGESAHAGGGRQVRAADGADALAVATVPSALDQAVGALERDVRDAYGAVSSLGEVAEIAAVRHMFHGFGIDPTRTRPASEALLRRVLRDEPLPRIHPAVDVSNLCSLEFLLPIGTYDREAVRGDVVCRLGAPGERMETIGGTSVDVDGLLVLADDQGPFGGPVKDAARTCVRDATDRILTVLFLPRALPPRIAEARAEAAAARFRDLLGLTIRETRTVV